LSAIFENFGCQSWEKSLAGTIHNRERTIRQRLITVSCKRLFKSKFLIFVFIDLFIFSDEHPQIRTCFDIHSDHLADSAVQFSRLDGDSLELQLRTAEQRKKDKRLMDAKDKLITFANSSDQDVSIGNLLKYAFSIFKLIFHVFRYCSHIRALISKKNGALNRANPDAVLKFDPLPEPVSRPALIRSLLRPNVVNGSLPPTPMNSQTNLNRSLHGTGNSSNSQTAKR